MRNAQKVFVVNTAIITLAIIVLLLLRLLLLLLLLLLASSSCYYCCTAAPATFALASPNRPYPTRSLDSRLKIHRNLAGIVILSTVQKGSSRYQDLVPSPTFIVSSFFEVTPFPNSYNPPHGLHQFTSFIA
ncbi:unnamed protein product [Coffea canephora]|uniref:Uncharacterized protein n=1 Tax=Coffea canephora TaxID=49390 RepID=A0A068UFM7_COFCA|nr:unnamed protein product [Coffea canephora]